MERNFLLLASFARSFDHYHVTNNLIHLIGSVFYCDLEETYIDFDALCKRNFKSIVIRLYMDNSTEFKIIKHDNNYIEFKWSIIEFISMYSDPTTFSTVTGNRLEDFIISITGDHDLDQKDRNNPLNNVLFVFENVNWLTLQLMFNHLNINISGGSISKRQYLSTAQYTLTRYLLLLNIPIATVYNSFVNLTSLLQTDNSYLYTELDKDLMIRSLQSNLELEKELIANKIATNEQDILIKTNNIACSSKDLSLRIEKKKSEHKDIKSKRVLTIKKRITILNKNIESKNIEITELKSQLINLNKELTNLDTLSFEDLKSKYIRVCQSNQRYLKSNQFKQEITKFNQRIKTPIHNRRYGTFSYKYFR